VTALQRVSFSGLKRKPFHSKYSESRRRYGTSLIRRGPRARVIESRNPLPQLNSSLVRGIKRTTFLLAAAEMKVCTGGTAPTHQVVVPPL
jgi:hypothetical protein